MLMRGDWVSIDPARRSGRLDGPNRPTPSFLCMPSGVICDSVGESSRAAYRSVRKLWPQLATFCSPLGAAAGGKPGGWLRAWMNA